MADVVYRLIPKIGKEVRKELWIQRWTSVPTKTLIVQNIGKNTTPILIFNSISKTFNLRYLPYTYKFKCQNKNRLYPNLHTLILIDGDWKFISICKLCLFFSCCDGSL
jgi:hypothetical protein